MTRNGLIGWVTLGLLAVAACGPREAGPVPPTVPVARPSEFLQEKGYKIEVPPLLDATDDPDPKIRWAAIKVLWEISAKDETVLDLLLRALKDTRPERRLLAARFIRDMGPRATSALPVMRAELKGATGWLRVALAEALWAIGRDADGATNALLAELAQGDGAAEPMALSLLQRIGPNTLPAIERARRGGDPALRKAADLALQRVTAKKP